jgi:RNA polymerase sigma factor (sigma-70 family)
MSETELLKAFREERSEEAFAELVRRYAGLVYSVAKRRLANAALAEDITQIVFIRFAKTPPKVQSHAELAAWLHRTTLNVAIDTWRSETRRRAREQRAVVMETANPETAIWEDISPNLDEALNQLNDDDRQALLLRFFGRKTMRDVGTALGVSEDAAKMRVSRAVDRLRTQLGVGSAACTAVVLGTILAEHSVEAAPSQLVSRLVNLKVPAAAGVAGMGGLLGALLRISGFKLAVGAVVLTLIGASTVHLLWPSNAPAAKVAVVNPRTNLTDNTTGSASRERFDSSGFDAPVAPAPKPPKMLFHVVDAETGEPLAGTRIQAAFFGRGGSGEGHDVLTDNNGVGAIPEPDDATKNRGMNVFVVKEGHVPKVVGFSNSGMPADYMMKLDPAMTVGGMVVDEQGQPVAGVKILVKDTGYKPDQMENVDFQTCPVTNHSDGSWSCSYFPKDYTNEIGFILKKPGYAVTVPWGPVDKAGLTNLVLVINRGFTVTGQITDPQNRPIADARIKTLPRIGYHQQSASTDENGIFTLGGVSGDTTNELFYKWPTLETNDSGGTILRDLAWQGRLHVELAVQADGFAPQTATVELLDSTNIANLTLSPGNIFRGRVVDEAGNPISNAIIRTDWDFKNQIETRFNWTTHADGNGQFEWDSAPAEEICYWFEADGYNVIRGMPLPADGSDHEITLKSNAVK